MSRFSTFYTRLVASFCRMKAPVEMIKRFVRIILQQETVLRIVNVSGQTLHLAPRYVVIIAYNVEGILCDYFLNDRVSTCSLLIIEFENGEVLTEDLVTSDRALSSSGSTTRRVIRQASKYLVSETSGLRLGFFSSYQPVTQHW